ncbi:MAG: inositol monophosphatase family protein [Ignavibacteria bacterium]|nr:inositol monophosphatase family protein [Ignavibacteria bacterium]
MKNILFKSLEESGKILKEYMDKDFIIESKDIISNLVTEVDKRSESKIIEIIKTEYPTHNILSEEIGAINDVSDVKWIIDPIDGTINYAHGIPICCVSIGVEKAGEIIMGGIYNPFSGEIFFAEKGEGSYLNSKKIHVSEESVFEKSLLVTGFPYNTGNNPNKPVEVFSAIVNMDIPVRRLGSAALDICWTACGRFDGFWEYNLNAWDVAAGYLILTEAGGKVTDFKGGKYSVYNKEILATNGKIHSSILNIIQNIKK